MIHLSDITDAVAGRFRLDKRDLLGRDGSREYVIPRQMAYALCRELSRHSYPAIGRHFGGRDHQTIIHGIRRDEARRREDIELHDVYCRLRAQIKAATKVEFRTSRKPYDSPKEART